MAVDESAFKRALSHFPSGITVVTTEHGGTLYGMTVASFASLSLRPPLILVCIEKTVKSHDAIAAAGKFGISILSEGQSEISNRFAFQPDDRFVGLAFHRGELGVPLIDDALTTIECRLAEKLEGGDHTIFVGEVMQTQVRDAKPLIYYRGGYHQLA